MAKSEFFPCDGCGQAASAEHTARRLQRLEWATRFRPVHIQVLLLGAAMPEREDELVYSPEGAFSGEAEQVLRAAGIAAQNREKEAVQSEFQRAGLFVAHVLECPVEGAAKGNEGLHEALEARLGPALARIRRSLKPKKLALISREMDPLAARFPREANCEVILRERGAFDLKADGAEDLERFLSEALAQRRSA